MTIQLGRHELIIEWCWARIKSGHICIFDFAWYFGDPKCWWVNLEVLNLFVLFTWFRKEWK